MSKTGGGAEAGQDKGGDAGKKDADADIYENRGNKKKILRLLTVVAYMVSVSFVAIVLSAYYIFLWDPPNPRLLKTPGPLSGEPEMEYLLGDPPVLSDELNQLESDNFLANKLPKRLIGRVIDDDFVNGSVRETKSHSRLSESLFSLRNSLMEFLRNRSNDSEHDRDSPQKNFIISNATKYTSQENGRRSNLTEESDEFVTSSKNVQNETTQKKIDDSKTVPIPVFLNISGNKDSSTSTERITNAFEKDASASNQVEKGIATSKNGKNIAKNRQTSRSKLFGEKYTNPARTSMFMNKFDVAMVAKNEENSEGKEEKRDHENGINRFVNDHTSVNSSHNLKFISRLKFPPRSNLSSVKLTDNAINSTETQGEKMTAKPITVENEQTLVSETVTTQRQKDFLTILTESTNTISTSIPSIMITEDFRTDPSTESEVSTITSPKST